MRLRPLPLVLAFASLFAIACTDDAPTVEPVDGNWNYFEMGVEENTCPATVVPLTPSSTFLLDYDGGDSFQIEQVDQPDVQCNLTGGDDFTCPTRQVSSSEVEALNLTLEGYIRIDGSFDSDAEAHGEQLVTIECVGEGCGALDDIPCSYRLPFTAEAQ
ncbi:hypothetical protein ACNOYE_02410 [Nannocystaceae bacterium ST9]